MEYKRINIIIAFLLSIGFSYAVRIVETAPPSTETGAVGTSLIVLFIGSLILIFLGLAVVGVLFWIIYSIWKKLSSVNRSNKDFLFRRFVIDSQQCHFNRDTKLKYRNWKRFFLFWKRHPVYIRSEKGIEIIGFYDGESMKKEGFRIISISQSLSLFKAIDYCIFIPSGIADKIIEKYDFGSSRILVLNNVEGIDEIGNTDYYFQLMIFKPNKQDFLDFSEMIYKEYFEKVTLRTTLKDNLLDFKEIVGKAVDMNPNLQHKRKGE